MHSTTLVLVASSCSPTASLAVLSLVYVVVVLLECSVHPYDVLEAEPEVVSGYYVDYGGYVFMVVFLAEGVAMPLTTRTSP